MGLGVGDLFWAMAGLIWGSGGLVWGWVSCVWECESRVWGRDGLGLRLIGLGFGARRVVLGHVGLGFGVGGAV